MQKLPGIVYHAGALTRNSGVMFATLKRRDAELWAEESDEHASVHEITHTCKHPASEDDVRAAAAGLGLTEDDFARISPYDNDPDYSPFDWLYEPAVRAKLVSLGFDCAVGMDFLLGAYRKTIVFWVPGTFKPTRRQHETLLRRYVIECARVHI